MSTTSSKTHPLYTVSSPRAWFFKDRPESMKYLSAAEDEKHRKSLLFHISRGDYFSTLVSVLRFFEETIQNSKDMPSEMRRIQLKNIEIMMSDLLYLEKNYDLVLKKKL